MPLINIPKALMTELRPALIDKLAAMDSLTQDAFLAEFRRQRKSIHVAFWLFMMGCHYLYVGRITIQILFWMTFGGFGMWYVIDFFRCRGMIRERNRAVAIEVFRSIHVLA